MTAEIIKFYPSNVMEKADNVLNLSVGQYSEVIVLGWDKDGNFNAAATTGLKDGADVLWFIELFKHKLMNGDYISVGDLE